MKKWMAFIITVLLIALVSIASADVPIDEAHFPDGQFREYITRFIDQDNDGILSNNEINNTNFIACQEYAIKSLKGIELFSNLRVLFCYDNELTSLDISQNRNLYSVMCYCNQITELDVSNCNRINSIISNNGRKNMEGYDYFGTPDTGSYVVETFLAIDPYVTVTARGTVSMPSDQTIIVGEGKLENEIYYRITNDGVLTLYGEGDMIEFAGCEPHFIAWNVNKAVIEPGITTIGDALKQCTMREILIPDTVTDIGYLAFNYCKHLEKIIIPNSVKSIGYNAFCGCSKLKNIDIPDSVERIDFHAFISSGVNRITIGSGLKSMGEDPFMECTELNEIIVSEENSYYSSDQGVMFNKDKTKLIRYPIGKIDDYNIPQSVETIDQFAFKDTNLTEIILPDSITEADYSAFYGSKVRRMSLSAGMSSLPVAFCCVCSSLSSIYLPKSITSIQPMAFYDCTALKDVYYSGTEADREKIEIETLNDALTNATWHYLADGLAPEVSPEDKIKNFITRCYEIILGREPDAGGLKTWFNELTSGRKTASEIIDRFVNSPEFLSKNYNYGDSVDILYQAMLGRNADAGGKANWVKKLESGQTLAHVINGFCFSREFRDLCDNYGIRAGFVNIENTDTTAEGKIKAFVQRCYRIILDREADPSGMQTWYEQLSSGKKAAAEIIDRFVNSPEFSGKRYSHSDSVEILYKAMLGRGSDAAGKANWVGKLDAGQPFAVVINGFCVSKEFTGICASYGIKPGNVNIQLSAQSEEELSMLALNAKAPITRRSETKPNRVEIINPSDTIDMNIGTAVQAVYINEEKAKEFIGRCYRVILGREASEAELETWIGQMVNGTKTPDQIARGFLFSNEFKAKNVSSEELVRILYRVYMNREADPEGLKTWTEKLDGGTSLNDLLDTFSKTNEFKKVVSEMSK